MRVDNVKSVRMIASTTMIRVFYPSFHDEKTCAACGEDRGFHEHIAEGKPCPTASVLGGVVGYSGLSVSHSVSAGTAGIAAAAGGERGLFDLAPSQERVPYSNHGTSRAAAESIKPIVGELRKKVYDMIAAAGDNGMTAFECYGAMGSNNQTISPRFVELHQQGFIRETDRTRKNPSSGRSASVYVAKPGPTSSPRLRRVDMATELASLRKATKALVEGIDHLYSRDGDRDIVLLVKNVHDALGE